MRAALLLNPGASRAGRGREVARGLAEEMDAPCFEVAGKAEIRRLARRLAADGVGRLVVAGGDGTVHEALNGLEGAMDRVEIAVLPMGTGNDLARSLGVPMGLKEAATLAREGPVRAIDVVRLSAGEERYFVNAAVGGFGGIISRKLTPERKRRWGRYAYRIQAMWELPRLRRYQVEVRLDDGGAGEGDSYCVVLANGGTVGGGIPVAPEALLDDGEVDVFLFPTPGGLATGRLLLAVLQGTHGRDPDVWTRRARSGTISSTPAMRFDVDGELVGSEPVRFEVLPRAIRAVVGPGAALSQEVSLR